MRSVVPLNSIVHAAHLIHVCGFDFLSPKFDPQAGRVCDILWKLTRWSSRPYNSSLVYYLSIINLLCYINDPMLLLDIRASKIGHFSQLLQLLDFSLNSKVRLAQKCPKRPPNARKVEKEAERGF